MYILFCYSLLAHPDELFVRIRGFSWTDSKDDIISFFKDENIKPGRIVIPMKQGKNIGEAIIEFATKRDATNAIKRHKQYLHNRYMEVYQSSFSDYLAKEKFRDGESQPVNNYSTNVIAERYIPNSGRGGRSSENLSHSSYSRAAPYYAPSPPIAKPYSPPPMFSNHSPSPPSPSQQPVNSIPSPPINPYTNYPNDPYNSTPYPQNQSPPPPPIQQQQQPQSIHSSVYEPPYNSKLPSHSFIVRIRGVPFTATKQTIAHFFSPIVVDDKNITIVLTREGRPSGGAFVVFNSEAEVRQALAKSKDKMSGRTVELFRSSVSELQNANNQNNNCLAKNITLRPGETAIIKLRGLPYSAQERDIVNFFKKAGVVEISEKSIHVARGTDGRPSGIAFAEFTSTDVYKFCKFSYFHYLLFKKSFILFFI